MWTALGLLRIILYFLIWLYVYMESAEYCILSTFMTLFPGLIDNTLAIYYPMLGIHPSKILTCSRSTTFYLCAQQETTNCANRNTLLIPHYTHMMFTLRIWCTLCTMNWNDFLVIFINSHVNVYFYKNIHVTVLTRLNQCGWSWFFLAISS